MAVTPGSFAASLLRSLGDPATPQNLSSIGAWEAEEGGNWKNTAKFNPLNTTEKMPGSGDTGTQGDIGVYQNWNQGLKATDNTLNNGDYGDILAALKTGKGLHGNLPGLKTWSGGGYTSIEGDSAPVNTAGDPIVAGGPTMPQKPTLAQPIANAPSNKPTLAQIGFQALMKHPMDPFDAITHAITTGGYAKQVTQAKQAIGTTQAQPTGDQFNELLTAAKNIAAKGYNYEWGGGHNATVSPTHGTGHGSGSGVGYDCSGAISAILNAAGKLKGSLVAAQFANAPKYIAGAKPGVGGPGDITIYANAEHTFSKIGNQYFGTSYSNPGGGAGFFKNAQTAGYQVWHVPLTGK